MGTARPGFWATADHEAAKVFGRRFWKGFIAFRIIRRVWVPVLVLLFVGAAAGFLWLSPPSGFRVEFRIPEIPEWGWWLAGTGVLIGLLHFLPSVRFFWVDLRYRFLP